MNYDENRRTYRDNFTTKATIEATERGYRVDDDGNVLNPQGVQLKTWPDTRGYLRFSLSTETKKVGNRKIYVHQLAAYQKFGRIVFAHGVEVRHLDNNHLNNSTSNLSYGSSSENEMDKLKEVRISTARKAAAARRKLSVEEAEDVRSKRASGAKVQQLADEYGVQKSTISYIINNKTYRTDEMSDDQHRDLHKRLEEQGYRRTKMMEAVREHYIKEWNYQIGSDDGDGGDVTEDDIEEMVQSTFAPHRPLPDAWRMLTEKDEIGRDWTIFEAVVIEVKPLTENQLREYTELWFTLDALDELVDLRLVRINSQLETAEDDLHDLFYDLEP